MTGDASSNTFSYSGIGIRSVAWVTNPWRMLSAIRSGS